jgi:hypothetical protein
MGEGWDNDFHNSGNDNGFYGVYGGCGAMT